MRDPLRLTVKECEIVKLLLGSGELYAQKLVEVSDGKLGRGTVYVTLDRLQSKGYVESRQEERHPGAIGLPRRMYKVTSAGEIAVHAAEVRRAALAMVPITDEMVRVAFQAQQTVASPHVSLLRAALEAAAPLIIEAYERSKTGDASP